jgi:hypothetical protein
LKAESGGPDVASQEGLPTPKKGFMSYLRQGHLLLYCLMLCGCAYDYPSGWPSLESARQDCISVSGVYDNHGVWVGRYGGSILAQKLFRDARGWPLKSPDLTYGVDSVEIAVTKEGTLDVTARTEQDRRVEVIVTKEGKMEFIPGVHQDSLVIKKQFFANKEEYRCNDGKIEISQVVVDLTGARQESLVLSKSIDGALVVKEGAVGLVVFVLPVYGNAWQRYMPYHPPKPQ